MHDGIYVWMAYATSGLSESWPCYCARLGSLGALYVRGARCVGWEGAGMSEKVSIGR